MGDIGSESAQGSEFELLSLRLNQAQITNKNNRALLPSGA